MTGAASGEPSSCTNPEKKRKADTEGKQILEEGGISASSSLVDDYYFTLLFDENELFPISDDLYAEELQLQEALMSATTSERKKAKCSSTIITPKKEPGQSSSSHHDHGKQSSPSPPELCLICNVAKPGGEMFRNMIRCSHSFCNDCIGKYVAAKIQDSILKVECPDLKCNGVLDPRFCHSFVPKEVFDRWENSLSENLLLRAKKFYCPFKDCSAVLVDDGNEVVTKSECPNCHRMFCAQCKVSWHDGIECKEFQKLGEEEGEREKM